jgi:hypothetical protein
MFQRTSSGFFVDSIRLNQRMVRAGSNQLSAHREPDRGNEGGGMNRVGTGRSSRRPLAAHLSQTAGGRQHLGVGGMARHTDQCDVSASIIEGMMR